MEHGTPTYTAFAGTRLVASGELKETLVATKRALDAGEPDTMLVFDDQTGLAIDFDFRGTAEEVLARLPAHPMFASAQPPERSAAGPGRPKLGVVCREVSLLPRHWEWLAGQPGGTSATLRRLVDEARKRGRGRERARDARDAASKFMWAMAGDYPGFEEASRALFAKNVDGMKELIRDWPPDVRGHIERLVDEFVRLDDEATAAGV